MLSLALLEDNESIRLNGLSGPEVDQTWTGHTRKILDKASPCIADIFLVAIR